MKPLRKMDILNGMVTWFKNQIGDTRKFMDVRTDELTHVIVLENGDNAIEITIKVYEAKGEI